jgi:8-oxo-dGTP pyrophosphatase MutT (NUDIX family)
MPISADTLVENFTRRLSAGQAALFVGAGLSKGSGLVDWKGLLATPAKELGIGIDSDVDFADLAEFFAQERGRGALIQHLLDTLIRPVEHTQNHSLIVHLPASEIWTTNYDTLLEDAFREAGKTCDVKRRDADFIVNRPDAAVRLYKMHGDLAFPEDIVITRTDYDQYDQRYRLMGSKFFNTVADTTLLFVGFSFSDPNFRRIMGSLASRLGGTVRQHYAVMLSPTLADARRFDLFLSTLTKHGIQATIIDKPAEITRILEDIAAKCRTPPEILVGQDARNRFLVDQLESLVRLSPTSPADLRIAAVFSAFAISDNPEYSAAEPSNSDTHMQLLLRERAAQESLVRGGSARLKLLLCPPSSVVSRLHVRYRALLAWLERNIDRPNLDVRCTTIDYFENTVIARDRFCVLAGYSPFHGYHENRVYHDRQSIEQHIRDFDDRFERADLARSKEEVINYYRAVVGSLSSKDDIVWRTASSRVLLQWRRFSLIRDIADVPGRGDVEYVFVRHPGSVIVIPVAPSGNLLLVDQYRYLTKSHSLEFPAGGLEPGELPLQAATREFREETGYIARHWERLGEFFTTNGITDECMTVFLADGLDRDRPKDDGDAGEATVAEEHTFEQVCGMVRDGLIRDGPTIVCLQYFREFLARR